MHLFRETRIVLAFSRDAFFDHTPGKSSRNPARRRAVAARGGAFPRRGIRRGGLRGRAEAVHPTASDGNAFWNFRRGLGLVSNVSEYSDTTDTHLNRIKRGPCVWLYTNRHPSIVRPNRTHKRSGPRGERRAAFRRENRARLEVICTVGQVLGRCGRGRGAAAERVGARALRPRHFAARERLPAPA